MSGKVGNPLIGPIMIVVGCRKEINSAFIWVSLEVTIFLFHRSEVVFRGVSLDYHLLTTTLGTNPSELKIYLKTFSLKK